MGVLLTIYLAIGYVILLCNVLVYIREFNSRRGVNNLDEDDVILLIIVPLAMAVVWPIICLGDAIYKLAKSP